MQKGFDIELFLKSLVHFGINCAGIIVSEEQFSGIFYKWQKDGVDISTSAQIEVLALEEAYQVSSSIRFRILHTDLICSLLVLS